MSAVMLRRRSRPTSKASHSIWAPRSKAKPKRKTSSTWCLEITSIHQIITARSNNYCSVHQLITELLLHQHLNELIAARLWIRGVWARRLWVPQLWRVGWYGMSWAGLRWAGLTLAGLVWAGLGYAGLGLAELGSHGLAWFCVA